jgi:2,5-diketo-D-gluconate reductase A
MRLEHRWPYGPHMSRTTENPARTRPLAGGGEIPYLGFGTYLIADGDAAAAVAAAIRAGYRHIDTAEAYRNEVGVGEGIRQALASEGLARSELFVTTKLWPGNAAWGQTPKTTEATIASLEHSLQRLGLDYVDLYLIHAPFERDQRLAQWRGCVELNRQGKARAIGVSNFSIQHIEELKAAGLPKPAVDQIELHPWSQKPELVRYLEGNEITAVAYSSLVPLSTWRTAAGQASAKTDQMKAEGEQADAPFKVMAKKYGVTEAQVLLRWAVQKGYPVLPKSTDPDRIRTNADIFGFTIDDHDMATIAQMDRGDGVAWGSGDPTKAP